jgi:hypothetical protein
MMDDEHRNSPKRLLAHLALDLVVPAARRKVEMSQKVDITRILLTFVISPGNICR